MPGNGWRAQLFPGSCSQPISCRHGTGRNISGMRVLVLLLSMRNRGIWDDGLIYFQVLFTARELPPWNWTGRLGPAWACVVVFMRGKGWRANLSPSSCWQPMSWRHGIERQVSGGACVCIVVCMRDRGWRAHLSLGTCSQPMGCRHGIGRYVLGVRVLVLLCVFGVVNGRLTCFQLSIRSP